MKIVSGTRVVYVNCVISNKIKINKTIQTLEDHRRTMETSPEMQWLPTKRIKSFGRRGLRIAIKNYLCSFVLPLIISMKKFLDCDWLREMQFFGNTVQKKGNLVQKRGNKRGILIG